MTIFKLMFLILLINVLLLLLLLFQMILILMIHFGFLFNGDLESLILNLIVKFIIMMLLVVYTLHLPLLLKEYLLVLQGVL